MRTDLPSLRTLEFGDYAFSNAPSFALTGLVERELNKIEYHSLRSVRMGNYAFQKAGSFEMSNLTSLQSIEFGNNCFGSEGNGRASTFSLIGMTRYKTIE